MQDKLSTEFSTLSVFLGQIESHCSESLDGAGQVNTSEFLSFLHRLCQADSPQEQLIGLYASDLSTIGQIH